MADYYIALLRSDGTEPNSASGYCRVNIGSYDIVAKSNIFGGRQIAFPDVKAPGYGVISSVAVCDREFGGKYLQIWDFPAAFDCHEGVVPVIHNGQLFRGMEVQAKVYMNSADLFGGM